eukprot:s1592_g7.t1
MAAPCGAEMTKGQAPLIRKRQAPCGVHTTFFSPDLSFSLLFCRIWQCVCVCRLAPATFERKRLRQNDELSEWLCAGFVALSLRLAVVDELCCVVVAFGTAFGEHSWLEWANQVLLQDMTQKVINCDN